LQRRWEYEPISVAGISSDDSLVSFDMKIVRISRGEYGISATVVWDYDTTDKTMVGTKHFLNSSCINTTIFFRLRPLSTEAIREMRGTTCCSLTNALLMAKGFRISCRPDSTRLYLIVPERASRHGPLLLFLN